MRCVIQRVIKANVKVDNKVISEISHGLMVLVGFKAGDNEDVFNTMIDKLIHLRIFEDEAGKMNLSLKDVQGELLIVPNFTLYGDCRKGKRPSYSEGASVKEAKEMFKAFMTLIKSVFPMVKQGQFQADMKVELINDGPVTLLLDSDRKF